ncbi:hypothetical protein PTKIN_Ptkin09bG0256600 [Pterospermum kingtungense]
MEIKEGEMEAESQNYGHEHPLQLLLNEEQMMISNQSGVSDCSRCGEKVSAPSFSCLDCGFYLHKQCAEAPLEINHPFHHDHPLLLLQNSPYASGVGTICDFCDKSCERFVYHCSCKLDFHIKCALFTYHIAEKKLKDQPLEHVPHQHLLVSFENKGEQLEDIFTKCFACQETLAIYAYFPVDWGFNLHKKCADLPLIINLEMRHIHPLALQFNGKRLSCEICQETQRRGLVYRCSPCNSVFHIDCVSNVEVKSHRHPLVLLTEEQMMSNQSGVALCWRCGEKVSASNSSFTCVECGFYLHKQCADAPLEIKHPFHHDHPLLLQKIPSYYTRHLCHFCDQTCQRFVYHCSCRLYFHIKCALFTYDIAEKKLKELQHVALKDPLISPENNGEQLQKLAKCFACWEPLANYTYFSLDCGFNLHKKCADLPLQVTDMCHKHPLALRFHNEQLFCKICQGKIKPAGFIYCCSPCNFALHIECLLVPVNVEVKSHQHVFTLFRRRVPFICDACGNEGNFVAYICCACNIIVHKRCISLPRVIKSKWHDHHFIFHTYFLEEEEEAKSWDCLICHKGVNVKHGSYCCSDCNIIFHVNCVTEKQNSYSIVSLENEDEKSSDSMELSSSTRVFERNDAGEATKVEHFKHIHNLMLSDKIVKYDQSCDGCMLPISDSFYYCSQCDFFLHKTCAELPKMKHVWHHDCREPLFLTSDEVFKCEICDDWSNGFSYKCNECEQQTCLRCVIALTPGAHICEGHEHRLLYYKEYEGKCSSCGDSRKGVFRCEGCNFALDYKCFSLPTRARHKCDKDLLVLTYRDVYNYSKCDYCDICEERRDPNHWFYHCATCDTSAHIDCVLGRFPYIKLGSVYESYELHPHPLTFVKKIYYYPDCNECGKPCQDLAFECAESGCNYIVHEECPW